ncbi:MAG: RloB domain-containing protein [Rhodobacteraceae bacterium]|nr:RloB domain-containing protein [Paracoccaceae bacterium]
MTKRSKIEPQKRVFLACEGESEQGYGAMLQRLVNEKGIKVHLSIVKLQASGNPLKLAENAQRKLEEDITLGRKFTAQAIMLDTDGLDERSPDRVEAQKILERSGIIAIWQRPDFEGLLLRHFSGHKNDAPPRGYSKDKLSAIWKDYKKPMSAIDLQKKIKLEDVLRAAKVEPNLAKLLEHLKLIEP